MNEARSVSEYVELHDDWRGDTMAALVALIGEHVPGVVAEMRWGQPVFSRSGPFAFMRAATRHVTIGFWRGRELEDEANILEGTGTKIAHVKLRRDEPIPAQLATMIARAAELNGTLGDPTQRPPEPSAPPEHPPTRAEKAAAKKARARARAAKKARAEREREARRAKAAKKREAERQKREAKKAREKARREKKREAERQKREAKKAREKARREKKREAERQKREAKKAREKARREKKRQTKQAPQKATKNAPTMNPPSTSRRRSVTSSSRSPEPECQR